MAPIFGKRGAPFPKRRACLRRARRGHSALAQRVKAAGATGGRSHFPRCAVRFRSSSLRPTVSATDPVVPPPAARTLWQRRIADPVVAQLTQGLSPQKIALTLAVGSAIALFPILGTATLLCVIVGVFMKLNQPILQVINYACTPIHLPFLYYSFRWGERLFGVPHSHLHLSSMGRLLLEHPLKFLSEYGLTAVHAVIVWAILAPFWITAIYALSLPLLRAIDRARLAAAKIAREKAPDRPAP